MKDIKPTFYIVVPSFNQAQFIEETLLSITKQVGFKVVCIVKDGGSKDGTVSILKKFGSKISFVSQKDKGQTDAINQGVREVLKLSKQPEVDIFAYLNSDDYYLPNCFKKVAAAFAAEPAAGWLIGECQIVNTQGQPMQDFVQKYKRWWRQVLSWWVLQILNPIPQPATFMRVSSMKQVGQFNDRLRFTMDYEYWLRLWKKIGKPMIIDETLAAFRIHEASKGTVAFKAQFAEQLKVAQRFDKNPAWQRLRFVIHGQY